MYETEVSDPAEYYTKREKNIVSDAILQA